MEPRNNLLLKQAQVELPFPRIRRRSPKFMEYGAELFLTTSGPVGVFHQPEFDATVQPKRSP
jgi:hypothetical protein